MPFPAVDALAFNAGKQPLSDPSVRKAASLALDRVALAGVFDESPTAQLLPPDQPGYRAPGTIAGPDVAAAMALMHGRRFSVRMASYAGCDACSQLATIVRAELARIGITVDVTEVDDPLGVARGQPDRFDLLNSFGSLDYPDPAMFLSKLLVDGEPSSWLPPAVRPGLGRLDGLTGDARVAAASDLANDLTTSVLPAAAFAVPVTGQFFADRLGCQVFPPFGYGVDIAALCVGSSS